MDKPALAFVFHQASAITAVHSAASRQRRIRNRDRDNPNMSRTSSNVDDNQCACRPRTSGKAFRPCRDRRRLRERQRETKQTRAGLTQTVEQLKTSVSDTGSEIRQRISPENIKDEVSDYVRSRGEKMLEDIPAAARRNPPLLKFAKAIPIPILKVGAGLFFAGSKTGQSLTQKASDTASGLSDELGRRGHALQAGTTMEPFPRLSSELAKQCQRERTRSLVFKGDDREVRLRLPFQGEVEVAREDPPSGTVVQFDDVALGMGSDLHGLPASVILSRDFR
jgi:hypothetical protein